MPTAELVRFFDERYGEIDAYLGLLQSIEDAARQGVPRLRFTNAPITPEQKRILSSSLYLQLYNLVEATVLRCLESVVGAIETERRRPSELSAGLRREWVRSVARTHSTLGPEKRLEAALNMCEQLLGQMPIANFEIERGGGGNWDDASIERICERVGCGLTLSPSVVEAAKRHVRDDMGALKLVRDRRNGLAHGSLSFVECSDGVTVAELRLVATAVGDYMREAVGCFVSFIDEQIVNRSATEGGIAS